MDDSQSALRTEVRSCLDGAGINQAAAARELGVSPKHLSQMLAGKATLTLEWAQNLLSLTGRELVIRSRRRKSRA